MTLKKLRLFLLLSRPHFLLGAILLYALGAGMAHYLGVTIHWGVYVLGQIWVSLVQLSTHYLNEYFDTGADADNEHRTPFSGGSGTIGEGKLSKEVPLRAAVVCLALAAYFSILLVRAAHSGYALIFLMGLIFLGAFFYSTPPVRLASSGYGELDTAIIVSNLVPSLAFLIQYHDFHRLLAMATFPLTFLHLAMMLAFEIPDYATDTKYNKQTLMVRIGWERGMLLHNFFLLIAYIILGLAIIFKFPISIALPGFLTLPLGLAQIWLLNRVSSGKKPPYKILTFLAVAIFGITAYLFTFAFWNL